MFDWNLLSSRSTSEIAESDVGSWVVNNPEPYYWRGKFQSPYLPGEDFQSTWAKRPQPMDHTDFEHRRVWARLNHQSDMLTAPTNEMIKCLIERIHANDHDGLTVEEILQQRGIELKDQSADFICRKKGQFTRRYQTFDVPIVSEGAKSPKGSLGGVIHHGSIHVSYEGYQSDHWWTILAAQTDLAAERHDNPLPVFWPEECTDVNAVIIKFMFDEVVDYARTKTFR